MTDKPDMNFERVLDVVKKYRELFGDREMVRYDLAHPFDVRFRLKRIS